MIIRCTMDRCCFGRSDIDPRQLMVRLQVPPLRGSSLLLAPTVSGASSRCAPQTLRVSSACCMHWCAGRRPGGQNSSKSASRPTSRTTLRLAGRNRAEKLAWLWGSIAVLEWPAPSPESSLLQRVSEDGPINRACKSCERWGGTDGIDGLPLEKRKMQNTGPPMSAPARNDSDRTAIRLVERTCPHSGRPFRFRMNEADNDRNVPEAVSRIQNHHQRRRFEDSEWHLAAECFGSRWDLHDKGCEKEQETQRRCLPLSMTSLAGQVLAVKLSQKVENSRPNSWTKQMLHFQLQLTGPCTSNLDCTAPEPSTLMSWNAEHSDSDHS